MVVVMCWVLQMDQETKETVRAKAYVTEDGKLTNDRDEARKFTRIDAAKTVANYLETRDDVPYGVEVLA